jgi:hypothetical protein
LTAGVIFFLWDQLAGEPVGASADADDRTILGLTPLDEGGGLFMLQGTF